MQKTITLQCDGCGGEFERDARTYKRNISRGYKNNYCSTKCLGPARRKELPVLNCLQCDKQFQRRAIRGIAPKFCSQKCAAIYNNTFGRGIVAKYCQECEEVEILGKARYCDTCRTARRYKSSRPDWTKITLGELRETYSISQYHAKVRGMARSEYKKQTGIMKCAACGYELHVDVCHIKDVKDFPLTATLVEVNNINNLVALDKRCHWEFDNGYLEL